MMGDLLEAVVAAARKAADERERQAHVTGALDRALETRPANGAAFTAALRAPGVRVIAECKRRSPSRGVLRVSYDPAAIARQYEHAGAAAISVLTEPTFFDGALDHLRAVRTAVTIPLLRKDFIVTDFQIHEAVAAGADAVLLIVAALDNTALDRLLETARRHQLAVLVEVLDRDELSRALDAGAEIVGINSRNLRTLEVDPTVLEHLGAAIPADLIAVAESGLKHAADLTRLASLRYDAFLIGERFMTDADPGAALAAMLQAAERTPA